jgi:hypothetical protein
VTGRQIRLSEVRGLAVAVGLGGLALAGSALASPASSDRPDLVPLLPTTTGHVAPIYTDTYIRPGRVLYRFSAVIKNLGGWISP